MISINIVHSLHHFPKLSYTCPGSDVTGVKIRGRVLRRSCIYRVRRPGLAPPWSGRVEHRTGRRNPQRWSAHPQMN